MLIHWKSGSAGEWLLREEAKEMMPVVVSLLPGEYLGLSPEPVVPWVEEAELSVQSIRHLESWKQRIWVEKMLGKERASCIERELQILHQLPWRLPQSPSQYMYMEKASRPGKHPSERNREENLCSWRRARSSSRFHQTERQYLIVHKTRLENLAGHVSDGA